MKVNYLWYFMMSESGTVRSAAVPTPHLPRLTCLYKFSPVSLDASEGVQLLCLIDKAADACRYLQTYGEWNRAAWLAKVTQRDAVHQREAAK